MFNLPLGWNDTPFPHWLLLPTKIWSLHQLTLPEVSPAWPEFSLGPCPVVHTPFLIPCVVQKFARVSSATGYLHMSLILDHRSGVTLLNPSHWNQVHTPQLYFLAICSVTAFSTNLITGLPWDSFNYHYFNPVIFVYGLLGGACVTESTSYKHLSSIT